MGPLLAEFVADAIALIPLATLAADTSGRVTEVNDRWVHLSGVSRTESEGPGWIRAVLVPDRHRLVEVMTRVAERGGLERVDLEVQVGQQRRWTRWTVQRHQTDTGPILVMVIIDIHAQHSLEAELQRMATHDSLTGLTNRAEFLTAAGLAMIREPGRVGMIYVDLDRFKEVNETVGHLLGDQVLAAAAERLRGALRPRDMIARVGGDEFAVLCEGVGNVAEVEAVATRLRRALSLPISVGGRSWPIGATTGVALSGSARSPEEVLDVADRAMYSAKTRQPRTALSEETGQAGSPGDPIRELVERIRPVIIELAHCAEVAGPDLAGRLRSAAGELEAAVSVAAAG